MKRQVEAVLSEFLETLERFAEQERIRRLNVSKKRSKWKEIRRLREAEERRVREFDEQLALWRTSRALKEYLQFAELTDPALLEAEWIGWARGRLATYESDIRRRLGKRGAA